MENKEKLLIPPHSSEAEQAVLSALMQSCTDAMKSLETPLQPTDFYSPQHQFIFKALQNMFDNGSGVDIITLTDELERRGKLDIVGGEAYLTELLMFSFTSANIEHHARIVKAHSTARQYIQVCTAATEHLYDKRDPEEVREDLEKVLLNSEDKPAWVNMSSAMDDQLSPTSEDIPLSTGWARLDEIHDGGLRSGDLVIIGARPRMGKTSFVTNMAMNLGLAGKRVLLFSVEMTTRQLSQRLISCHSGIPASRIRQRKIFREEEPNYHNTIRRLREIPLGISDNGTLSLGMCKSISRSYARRGLDCVMVDYLQFMQHPTEGFSTNDKIGILSRGLKSLAKELEIPVIALSQLSRKVEDRFDKKPNLSDLRDSGAIEQDADIIWLLYRPGEYGLEDNIGMPIPKTQMQLIVGKQRNGPAGIDLDFDFNLDCNRITEPIDNAPF